MDGCCYFGRCWGWLSKGASGVTKEGPGYGESYEHMLNYSSAGNSHDFCLIFRPNEVQRSGDFSLKFVTSKKRHTFPLGNLFVDVLTCSKYEKMSVCLSSR